jgi:hypothetical protein
MTRARYFQWMAIFEWFQAQESSGSLETLYDQLNQMWHEDRKGCTESQLAGYFAAWARGDIEIDKDAKFQEFLREMNDAFRKRTET